MGIRSSEFWLSGNKNVIKKVYFNPLIIRFSLLCYMYLFSPKIATLKYSWSMNYIKFIDFSLHVNNHLLHASKLVKYEHGYSNITYECRPCLLGSLQYFQQYWYTESQLYHRNYDFTDIANWIGVASLETHGQSYKRS